MLESYASQTKKKSLIMWIGVFFWICWRGWIMTLNGWIGSNFASVLSSSHFPVLISGSSESIYPKEDWGKEPSLSFPLPTHGGFGNMLITAQKNSWLWGFKVNNRQDNCTKITHLLYADHAIILCDAEVHRGGPNEDIENHSDNSLRGLGLHVTGRRVQCINSFRNVWIY